MSVNRVILVGNLGQDPEAKTLDFGPVTNFSMATSKKWKKDGQDQSKTEWHRITCFGKLAEITAKYLKKGSSVYLEGELRTRSWDKDGETRYATEIVADKIEFLSSAKSTEITTAQANTDEEIGFKALGEDTPVKVSTQTPGKTVKNYAPGGQDRKF